MSGQGGMLCTDDEEIYIKAKLLSHQGIKKELGHEYFGLLRSATTITGQISNCFNSRSVKESKNLFNIKVTF